jgi:hypothetical protein
VNSPPLVGLADIVRALEHPYRSRGEARVARTLDQYNIPFFYEKPTLIYDRGRHRVWHPDFSLPSYNGLIVEYAGMMDVPDYARGIQHKRRAYAANGISVVFVYPEDLAKPDWQEGLVESIYEAAKQPLSPYFPPNERNVKAGYW